jgi:hypothetical protein
MLIDVTDHTLKNRDLLKSSIPQILTAIGVSTSSGGYSGGEVKIFTINDLSDSPSKTVTLRRGVDGALGQNPLDRLDEIKAFEAEFNKALDTILDNTNWDRNQSKIYQNICREINKLSNSPSNNKKVMIIFSDMLENSELFSFYRDKEIENLSKNIGNLVEKKLDKECPLPNLEGIKIFVVTSRKPETDTLINKAEIFWKELFRRKNGAASFDSELDIK